MNQSYIDYIAIDQQQCAQFLSLVDCATREVEEFLGTNDGTDSEDHVAAPVACSTAMQQVLALAKRYAETQATILLTGESGTGKEVVARYIHRTSPRAAKEYVRVNCAALSETLIESELFGHVRGAFTGADKTRVGWFESAGSGTLLLDEISEIPLRTQAKLLRALEEEEFQRVGCNETLRLGARIIATSNRDLKDQVRLQEFRSDLFYRLDVLHLHIPPLRERPEDIPGLVKYFVHRFGVENRQPVTSISHRAMQRILTAEWPGNVRELRNVIHRACILATNGCIDLDNLIDLATPRSPEAGVDVLNMRLDDLERLAILSNLRRFHGNKTATAKHLGVTSRTLANKMKRYRELGLLQY